MNMKALVLEKVKTLNIREIDVYQTLGPNDVRIKMKNVGICGSDLHFYQHGKIGPFVLKEPMILGHEGSGEIIAIGSNVQNLSIGDRVCMEPGIPNYSSRASKLGMYNLDPKLTFWATPPVHGCLCTNVVHPASLTYKLPDNVSLEEGAMVEPLAIGMYASVKADITPGDIALIFGAGTIGIMTMISALAGGCSKVIISDIRQERLDLIKNIPGCIVCNTKYENLKACIDTNTDGWGVDIAFEASGSEQVTNEIFHYICPGGHLVYIGMPNDLIKIDIVEAQSREIRIDTIFRYANVYERAIALLSSGKIDIKPFITEKFSFIESIEAFEYACSPKPSSVKIQIEM